ncbi:MAG: ribosomal protein S18-alanine N-acetyltransferase [Erysipelotrichaceae bacterium]
MDIKIAEISELNALVEIEELLYSDPYSLEQLTYELNENPFSKTIVLKIVDKIVAMAIYWIIFDQVQIVRIGVLPKYRNKNYAQSMLNFIIDDSRPAGCEIITLEVRASNAAAIALYDKNGFECVSSRKNYYQNPSEDALVMMKGLI